MTAAAWISIATTVVNTIFITINIVYTARSTSKREQLKWKREELTKVISEMISLSSERELTLDADWHSAFYRIEFGAELRTEAAILQQLTTLTARVQILAPGQLTDVAQILLKEHQASHNAPTGRENWQLDIDEMQMSKQRLEAIHRSLSEQFLVAIGEEKKGYLITNEKLAVIRAKEKQLQLANRNWTIVSDDDEAEVDADADATKSEQT